MKYHYISFNLKEQTSVQYLNESEVYIENP